MGKVGRKPTGRSTTLVRVPLKFVGLVRQYIKRLKRGERCTEPFPTGAITYLFGIAERYATPSELEKLKVGLNQFWVTQLAEEKGIAEVYDDICSDHGDRFARFLISIPQPSDPWWIVLGVDQEATEKEVRQSYRALQRQWHPDVKIAETLGNLE